MRRERLIPVIAFLVALTAYLATLAPGVVGGDSGEMQFVPHVLGIAHWTGYPLYTMVGKLWEIIIPVGSVAWRMNLLSAVASAAAVALVCMAGRRLAGAWLGGVIAALALGASPLFWNWAIVAGVRSVTVFFAVLLLALALEWGHATRQGSPTAGRFLLALAAALGLSLAHHRTTIFLVPGLVIYIVWTAPSLVRRWRLWLPAVIIAGLLPLLFYLYIPIRSAMNPPYAIMEAHTLRGFLALVFAPTFAGGIAAPLTIADLPPRALDAVRQFGREFTWPLVGMALVGLLVTLRRQIRVAVLLLIPFVLSVAFTINYNLGNSDLNVVFLLPAYAVFALLIGYGAAALIELCQRLRRQGRALAMAAVMIVALYIVVFLARPTWQAIQAQAAAPLDAYRLTLRGEQGERLLQLSVPHIPDGAVLIGDWEQLTPFWYAELVEQRLSGLAYHYPMEPDWPAWVNQARQEKRPIFLARRADSVIGQRFLSTAGPLVEMRDAPATAAPAGITPQNVSFGDQLELVGYRFPGLSDSTVRRDGVLSLGLFWRARRQLSANYAVSVRLVSGHGQVVSSVDYAHPVLAMYPTSLWQPGEVVGDFYELDVAASLAAGEYHVEIVVYAQEGGTFRNLLVEQGGRMVEQLALPPINVR